MFIEILPNQKVQVRGFSLDSSAESGQLSIATFGAEEEGKLPTLRQISRSQFKMKEMKTSVLLVAVFKSEFGLDKTSEVKSNCLEREFHMF